MSQPRQQAGLSDMQVWQQQLMHRQIQELQRQQQIHQLDQGGTQHNSLCQLSAATKQATINQFPALLNGMPLENASNYILQNAFMGGESKILNSSQTFISHNTKWGQCFGSPTMHDFQNGPMFSNDQGQTIRSTGLIPQKPDQSLYGTPISSNRASLNEYTNFQGMACDPTVVMNNVDDNQKENMSMQSAMFHPSKSDHCVPTEEGYSQDNILVLKQGFQQNSYSRYVAGQSPNSGVTSGNIQQVSLQSEIVQIQEFQGRQQHADWSNNLEEKAVVKEVPSSVVTSLDSTEQKLLFGSEDGDWDVSFGRSSTGSAGGHLHGNPLEGNDYLGTFSSLQSGSWSALMQEAVDASSSDTGLQEGWSGVTFQKTELSTGNQSAVWNDSGRQQRTWDDHDLQSASSFSSTSFPLFNDADANPNFDAAASFQHSCMGGSAAVMNSTTLKETKEMNQDVTSEHQLDSRNLLVVNSFVKCKRDNIVGQHQLSGGVLPWEKTMNTADRGLGDAQKSLDQSGQSSMRPQTFQHHPVGTVGMNIGPVGFKSQSEDFPSRISYSECLSPSTVCGLKNQNQGYAGNSLLVGHSVPNNAMDMGKGYFTDLERNMEGPKAKCRGTVPEHDFTVSSSSDGSTAQFSHNRMISQISQNILELHKVDQSADDNNARGFTLPVQSTKFELPEATTYDGSASCSQHNYFSALRGFGQRLALPSQQQRVSNHALPYQASMFEIKLRQPDPEAQCEDRTWPASPQSQPPVQEESPRENWDGKCNISENTHAEMLQLCAYDDTLSIAASTLPCSGNQAQLQQQNTPNPIGHEVLDKSVNHSFGSQADVDVHVNKAIHFAHFSESFDGDAIHQPLQVPMSGMAGRIPPFRLTSCSDPCASVASQFYSFSAAHIQNMKSSFPLLPESQQVLASEEKSISQGSTTSGMTLQAGFSSMLSNVQAHESSGCLSGLQPHKFTPHILQSMIPSSNRRDMSSGSSFLFSQTEHIPNQNIASSNEDVGAYGRISKLSNDVKNYSLLQQMQAMKGADSDPTKRAEKRLKGAEYVSDASKMDWRTAQKLMYSQNPVFKVPADVELGISPSMLFQSDVKMLRFSSGEHEENSATSSSQFISKEVPSQDLYTSGQQDQQGHAHCLNLSSPSLLVGGNEPTQSSLPMAQSRFEQHGSYENGQILAIYDGQENKTFASQYLLADVFENMENNSVVEQRDDTSQINSLGQNTSSITITVNGFSSPHCLPSTVIDHKPKKRKTATSELQPWRKEVMQGSRRLQSISIAELEWAWAANRKIEKMEDEVRITEDGLLMPRPRRRLILTTQLMQQLLPSVRAAILREEAASAYGSMLYLIAKAMLADACSLISYSGSNSFVHLDIGNMRSERLRISKKVEDCFSQVVEDLIGRSRNLEIEFLRLDKRTSVSDTRLEYRELERFSIINRLCKFHGRSHKDTVVNSPSFENGPHRMFPQRYVTTLPMMGKLPDRVPCLAL